MFPNKNSSIIPAQTSFYTLYNTVFPVIYKVAYRITGNEEATEDLCQEAFLKLYEKKMVFPNTDEAKYWLIRVVKNAALNYAKRKERERKAYQKAFHEDHRVVDSGESTLIKEETKLEVQETLDKLPKESKEVLILKAYAEMNYKEIGRTLNINEGNVKVRVFRAKERFLKLLP